MRHEKIILMVQFGKIQDICLVFQVELWLTLLKRKNEGGGGIEVNPLGFFLILSSVFSLGCSPFQKPWKLFFYVWDTFCIWIWWKINDKRGVVLQAYKKRMKVLILKLMGSTVPILFIFFHILQFPMKFVSKCSFNKPKLHFLDGGLQLVVLMP